MSKTATPSNIPAFQFHCMDSQTLLLGDRLVEYLSIPLYGFVGGPRRAGGLISLFQFHCMDSQPPRGRSSPRGPSLSIPLYGFRDQGLQGVRGHLRDFQFHCMDSYDKLVEVFLYSRATFQFHCMDSQPGDSAHPGRAPTMAFQFHCMDSIQLLISTNTSSYTFCFQFHCMDSARGIQFQILC